MTSSIVCCGTPTWNACGVTNAWDDIFGNGGETQQAHQGKVQQDWDNPFGVAPPANNNELDARSENMSQGRSVAGHSTDTRSVGSAGLNSISHDSVSTTSTRRRYKKKTATSKSYLDGKSLRDIEREQKAKSRALQLSESMVATKNAKPLFFGRDNHVKLSAHHTALASASSNDESRMADKANEILLRKTQSQISQTESTRDKRPLTAEEVGDPESVPGMKSALDKYLEKEAKKKSSLMISNGRFPYNDKAGMAIWSVREIPKKSKGGQGVSELV